MSPPIRGETLRQAEAMGLKPSADGVSWVRLDSEQSTQPNSNQGDRSDRRPEPTTPANRGFLVGVLVVQAMFLPLSFVSYLNELHNFCFTLGGLGGCPEPPVYYRFPILGSLFLFLGLLMYAYDEKGAYGLGLFMGTLAGAAMFLYSTGLGMAG